MKDHQPPLTARPMLLLSIAGELQQAQGSRIFNVNLHLVAKKSAEDGSIVIFIMEAFHWLISGASGPLLCFVHIFAVLLSLIFKLILAFT